MNEFREGTYPVTLKKLTICRVSTLLQKATRKITKMENQLKFKFQAINQGTYPVHRG